LLKRISNELQRDSSIDRSSILQIVPTFLQLYEALGQRVHGMLRHGEDQPIGETFLQSGIRKEAGNEFLQASDSITGGSRWSTVTTHQLHLEGVAGTIEIFQMLSRTNAPQFTLHHYANS